MNYDEALARLDNGSLEGLQEWCYESHKDFYGVKGRWFLNADKAECISWIKNHFVWDNDGQYWRNAVPFNGE